MKDIKYNHGQKKKALRTVEKKKRKIEGKKPNRHIVHYVCQLPLIEGTQ
jgi:hypothetical protein